MIEGNDIKEEMVGSINRDINVEDKSIFCNVDESAISVVNK